MFFNAPKSDFVDFVYHRSNIVSRTIQHLLTFSLSSSFISFSRGRAQEVLSAICRLCSHTFRRRLSARELGRKDLNDP